MFGLFIKTLTLICIIIQLPSIASKSEKSLAKIKAFV